jgi:hypothetical protein
MAQLFQGSSYDETLHVLVVNHQHPQWRVGLLRSDNGCLLLAGHGRVSFTLFRKLASKGWPAPHCGSGTASIVEPRGKLNT